MEKSEINKITERWLKTAEGDLETALSPAPQSND
jgi:hypothetical protein